MFVEGILVLVLIYFLIFCFENIGNSKSPPGPVKIPPFGNLIQVGLQGSTAHLGLHNMSKKYGDVMSLKMGLMDTIVLSSYEAAKQVFSKEESYGRKCTGTFADRCQHRNIGLGLSNEEAWQDMRSFCREALRDHGYGDREGMQNLMIDELVQWMRHMEQEARSNPEGRITFTSNYFHRSFLNLMLELVIGQRFDYEDKELNLLMEHGDNIVKNGMLGSGIIAAYPSMRYVFPEMLGHNSQMKGFQGHGDYATELLYKRRREDYQKSPTCFADEFLKKIDEDASKTEPFFTEQNFAIVMSDILVAGTDTTSHVINFILLHLAYNQDIQQKFYEEICNNIGTQRLPDLGDKFRMPYTQAVLLEGLRYSRVIVLGVPRKALSDFTYRDFIIKKGTVMMVNLHSILFDAEFWGDPNVFRPERFFDDEGNLDANKTERIISFGSGKRNCFGEAFARDSLFLFTTSLVQKFNFKLPTGSTPNFEPVVGITLSPHPYEAIVTVRSHNNSD